MKRKTLSGAVKGIPRFSRSGFRIYMRSMNETRTTSPRKREISAAAYPCLPPHCREAVAARLLPPVETLLDLGCGEGRFLLETRGKYRRGLGLDADIAALRAALRRGLPVALADLEAGEFPSRPVAAAVCLDVIEHVRDPRVLLGRIRRALRDGGLLILSTPNIRQWRRLLTLALRGSFPPSSSRTASGYDGGHLHYFTAADLLSLLRGAGFQPLRLKGIFPRKGFGRLIGRFPFLSSARPAVEFLAAGVVVMARKAP